MAPRMLSRHEIRCPSHRPTTTRSLEPPRVLSPRPTRGPPVHTARRDRHARAVSRRPRARGRDRASPGSVLRRGSPAEGLLPLPARHRADRPPVPRGSRGRAAGGCHPLLADAAGRRGSPAPGSAGDRPRVARPGHRPGADPGQPRRSRGDGPPARLPGRRPRLLRAARLCRGPAVDPDAGRVTRPRAVHRPGRCRATARGRRAAPGRRAQHCRPAGRASRGAPP